MARKALVFTAPSGAGKTTIIRRLQEQVPGLQFSVSATSRQPRAGEEDGKAYHFLSPEEFQRRVAGGEFVEWEQVYEGMYYGTLRSEVERIWDAGATVVFDIDVKGALNVKEQLGEGVLTIFIAPPSLDALRERLVARGTETPESLAKRLSRAEMELAQAERFDTQVVNDDLDTAVATVVTLVRTFLGS